MIDLLEVGVFVQKRLQLV